MPQDTVLDCPYCPKTFSRAPRTSPEERAAKHVMASGGDHEENDYPGAREAVEAHNAGSDEADETETEPPADPEGSGVEDATVTQPTAGAFDPTEDAPGGNPILRPPVMADGGQVPPCPDCGDMMGSASPGHVVTLSPRGAGTAFNAETEGGEHVCVSCGVMKDNGEVYDYE